MDPFPLMQVDVPPPSSISQHQGLVLDDVEGLVEGEPVGDTDNQVTGSLNDNQVTGSLNAWHVAPCDVIDRVE
jgi:hypothetical protein